MYTALNVNRKVEKMFLPWLEGGGAGGREVRHALTHIHLPPFISLLRCLTPSLSRRLPHDTHTHTH